MSTADPALAALRFSYRSDERAPPRRRTRRRPKDHIRYQPVTVTGRCGVLLGVSVSPIFERAGYSPERRGAAAAKVLGQFAPHSIGPALCGAPLASLAAPGPPRSALRCSSVVGTSQHPGGVL